jgi:hypothetical protein
MFDNIRKRFYNIENEVGCSVYILVPLLYADNEPA